MVYYTFNVVISKILALPIHIINYCNLSYSTYLLGRSFSLINTSIYAFYHLPLFKLAEIPNLNFLYCKFNIYMYRLYNL